jgi:hypothetical protein
MRWSRKHHEQVWVLLLILLMHGLLLFALTQDKLMRDDAHPTLLVRLSLLPLTSAPPMVALSRTTALLSSPLRSTASPTASRPSATPAPSNALSITAEPAPSALPTIDLEAARKMALDFDRQRVRTPIERLQAEQQPTRSPQQQLGNAIQDARRKDCLKDYAGTGLLAPLFMMSDLMADKACKM